MPDPAQAPSSRVARTAAAVAMASVATAALGILGVQIGLLSPLAAFYLFALGAVLGGVISLVLGGVGLFLTNGGRDPLGARRSWLGAGGGVLLLGAVLMGLSGGGGQAPPINDISTDLSNPPGYAAAAREEANQGRDMSYPAEFVQVVRSAYPDLGPMEIAQSRDVVYQAALASARRLGWTIIAQDPAAGTFEAQEQSTVFHFVDDISVRVVSNGATSVVDVRSKSRDGRSDMGVNAARIRAFGKTLSTADVASR